MLIIPAILTENADDAIAQMQKLAPVAQWMQIDVLDDTFLPGHTAALTDLVGKVPDVDLEVHLMVNDPQKYFETCERLEARRVYFHYEAVEDQRVVLDAMRGYGFERGMAVNPGTSIAQIEPYFNDIDVVLIMTVEPGRQGAPFVPSALQKIDDVKARYPHMPVAVDGGVSPQTLVQVRDAGADAAGVGSAISRADDPAQACEQMQALVA